MRDAPSNVGPGAARNHGIAATTGELVAFLDADDYWMPTHVEDVAGLLERYPESAVAFSRIRRFGEEELIAPEHVPEGPPSNMFWQLIEENIVAQSSAVVRRDILVRNGRYDATLRYSEDYDLWLRLARRYPFVCTSAVTACYRVHPNQASRNVTQMVLGRWRVKNHFWSVAKTKETPAFVEQLETQMLSRLAYGLQSAWDERNEAQCAQHWQCANSSPTAQRFINTGRGAIASGGRSGSRSAARGTKCCHRCAEPCAHCSALSSDHRVSARPFRTTFRRPRNELE